MRVKWSERARRQRDEVANYIRQQFGAKRKYKFKQEIREIEREQKQIQRMLKKEQRKPLFAILQEKNT